MKIFDARPLARLLRRACHLAAGAALLLAAQAQAQVGMSEIRLGELPVTLVYPTAETAQVVKRGPFELSVATNAAPRPEARRLVVMSHGTGGSPLADHTLAARLALAGLVVAQPLHRGDNHADASQAGPTAWESRPAEVIQVIDGLAAHPIWGPQLQLDKVGVHGMSAGGLTALVVAGGTWNTLQLVQHCLDHMDADAGFCFQGVVTAEGRATRRDAYERVRGVPEMFLPARVTTSHGIAPDARVVSVTVSVPLVAPFSAASLADLRVPVGVVSAARDEYLLPRFHSDVLLQHCAKCVRLADVPSGGHMDMLSPWPADLAQTVGAKQARGGYPEPGFQPSELMAAFDRIVAFHTERLGR